MPSIAIREGVLASIELLRDHLRGLYDNVPFDASVYDSKHLGRVRQFATANTIQLLVMNIQAFQKDVEEDADPTKANVINRAQDRMSGRRPIEFIQATRPVVIIDEPQNMESERPRRRLPGSTRSARCATRRPTSARTTASIGSDRRCL